MLPQTNYKGAIDEVHGKDLFFTPLYPVEMLKPYIIAFGWERIWDPATGDGWLAAALRHVLPYLEVVETDLITGQNFYTHKEECDALIGNPPFSRKEEFIDRALELNVPFAFLMPSTTQCAGWMSDYIDRGVIQVISPKGGKRVDYLTPEKLSWIDSSSQFHSSWFVRKFGVSENLIFRTMAKPGKKEMLSDPWWRKPAFTEPYQKLLERKETRRIARLTASAQAAVNPETWRIA